MDFTDIANRFGIPWAVTIVIALVFWRTVNGIVGFAKDKFFSDERDKAGKPVGYIPRFIELFELHQLKMQEKFDAQTEVLKTMDSKIQKKNELILEMMKEQTEIKNKINCPRPG